MSGKPKAKDTQSFVDPELTLILDSLIEKVANRSPSPEAASKPKLHKISNPFLMKNSLNSSLVSTCPSDEAVSCERTSDLSCKNTRTDSLTENGKVIRKASERGRKTSNVLTRIPEQLNDIFECMMSDAIASPSPFTEELVDQDCANSNMSIKKPVPNKYKTEICRNWKLEGF